MLGAVGAYGWTGTVVHKNAQNSEIFPKEAFERILEDKNHSSLLGKWLREGRLTLKMDPFRQHSNGQ